MSRKPRKRMSKKLVQDTEDQPAPIPTVDAKPEIDDDEPTDPADGLNIRRRKFVEHITTDAMGNATKAARLAGYADDNYNALRVTGSYLLTIPNVQKAIARAFALRRMDVESIKQNIASLCGADMSHFLKVGPDGQPEFDWKAAAAAGAIGEVREYQEDGIAQGQQVTIIKRKFKIHDKLRALDLLAKVNGMMTDRVDLTSGGKPIKGYVVVSPSDWDALSKPKPADAEHQADSGV